MSRHRSRRLGTPAKHRQRRRPPPLSWPGPTSLPLPCCPLRRTPRSAAFRPPTPTPPGAWPHPPPRSPGLFRLPPPTLSQACPPLRWTPPTLRRPPSNVGRLTVPNPRARCSRPLLRRRLPIRVLRVSTRRRAPSRPPRRGSRTQHNPSVALPCPEMLPLPEGFRHPATRRHHLVITHRRPGMVPRPRSSTRRRVLRHRRRTRRRDTEHRPCRATPQVTDLHLRPDTPRRRRRRHRGSRLRPPASPSTHHRPAQRPTHPHRSPVSPQAGSRPTAHRPPGDNRQAQAVRLREVRRPPAPGRNHPLPQPARRETASPPQR